MTSPADAGGAASPRLRDEWKAYWSDDAPRLLHIVKVAMAATLAMGLCMRLELRTPGTAMVSCVIVMMHQQSGMVIARGFYRGLGMVCGSLAGLVLIALFPQQPLPFFLALAAWIGACVFGASYYRNFQSYGFVLAGYGTAITAMPAWSNPYGVFDNVVFTVSEVVIGVVCASVISAAVFPQRVTPALYASSQRNFTHLLNALHAVLERTAAVAGFDLFLDLIRERAGVETLRSGAVFEDPSIRLHNHLFLDLDRSFLDTVAWIHALHQLKARVAAEADPRVLAVVDELLGGLLAIVPDRRQTEPVALDQVQTMLARLDAFEQALPAQLQRLLQSLDGQAPQQRQFAATTGAALFFSIADLRLLCRAYVDARVEDRQPWNLSVFQALSRIGRTRATANRTAALVAGARAAIAVLAVGAGWLASGWVNGSSAIVAVAITSALFALVPNPAVVSWQIFGGCLAGWLAGFGFNFFLLPRFDNFPLLAATIAIFVMVGSYVNSFAKTAVLGLGFSIYFCFIVSISNPTVYNPSAYLDTGFALLVGIAAAAVAFSIIVPRAGDWISARYLKQIRALVAESARDDDLDDLLYSFELSLRDFIIQIAAAPVDPRVDRNRLIGWAFAALEIGRAMIQVRLDTERLGGALPSAWAPAQDAWLAALAELFCNAAPQAAQDALAATRRALVVLPIAHIDTVDATMLAHCRMRALLHFTELTLQDDTVWLWQTTGAAA
ncbi:FUSC family protein [Paraburkholderia sp. BL21I4N1]|uniref:FUSC family protein n=1 Tax=Paraburkholderia sp. BL21I4N1 TaxID=1938801 RepID=UPI000CFC206A|nr:FUSC family protein [Paraburkholderia sp. BL21I4N1]PQV44836.1 putative membrane protein YccC [Paraburkholderia sp. BL21I4N1]